MQATDIFFYIFSALAIIFSGGVVLSKKPITSAFSLILVFFCVAADYALLQAHFIAAIQILVYAGAIMVLFVFVIMLLNSDVRTLALSKNKTFQIAASVLCVLLAGVVIFAVRSGEFSKAQGVLTPEAIDAAGGNVQVVSTVLFSDYVLPFELTSVLLLVGIVGSVALAKRRS